MKLAKDEYYFLTEKLDEVTWAIEGSCNDIDCDKYLYKDLLKKKYKPVLEHNFSCLAKLKREKEAIFRLLSVSKFKRFRYKKCQVCKKEVDSLGKEYVIVGFMKPSEFNGQKAFQHKGIGLHGGCKKLLKTPKGWQRH